MKIELLAPAGKMDSLIASINAGCDAIYLGGRRFSARASAVNFSDEDIVEAVKLARMRGVKIFVTTNILISDGELDEFFEYIDFLNKAGCHGVIVQDPALGFILSKMYDDLEVHASTQMTINNYYGAKYVKELGFERVVMAREVGTDTIKKVSKLGVDIEHFIHGALCISYSGQCTMSSLIGGRSGNRGACAQACRKPYEILNPDKTVFSDKKYFLSPRDLMSFDTIDELIKAGVNSFKIEGRMKRPEYAYEVVHAYRKKLDNALEKSDIENVEQLFNRKFTKGLGFKDFGRSLMSYDRPDNRGVVVGRFKNGSIILDIEIKSGDGIEFNLKNGKFKGFTINEDLKIGKNKIKLPFEVEENSDIRRTYSRELEENIDKEIENIYKLPIEFKIDINVGNPIKVIAKSLGKTAEYTSENLVEKAKNMPISVENIRKSFEKINDTNFFLRNEEDLEIITDGKSFVPVSVLNEARRGAIKNLEELFLYKNSEKTPYEFKYEKRKTSDTGLTLEINDLEVLDGLNLDGVEIVYIPLKDIEKLSLYSFKNTKKYIKLPQILTDDELEKAKENIEKYRPEGLLLNNLGQLEMFKDSEISLTLDSSFNIFNSISGEFFLKQSDCISLSNELNLSQIKEIRKKLSGNLESIVYGYLNVMVMEHCPISIELNCKDNLNCEKCRRNGLHYLRDSMGEDFGFRRENRRTIIYNSHPLLYDNKNLVNFIDRRRIVQTTEDRETMEMVLNAFRENDFNDLKDFFKNREIVATRGHYNRGIIWKS